MPQRSALRGHWLAAALAGALFGVAQPAVADPNELNAAIDALRRIEQPESGAAQARIVYQATLDADPLLLQKLQQLFAPYFDTPPDLVPLLRKIITESAVAAPPGLGRLLYNPAHMLLIHLPEDWRDGGVIRVAPMTALRELLGRERPATVVQGSYVDGFEAFALAATLIAEPEARETLEVIWSRVPRSSDHRLEMQYLLLRPLEQSAAIRDETAVCRRVINRFVDEVRAGKREAITAIPHLINIVKPTRFVRQDSELLLVLGESVMARYYVIARFRREAAGCSLASEQAIFAM